MTQNTDKEPKKVESQLQALAEVALETYFKFKIKDKQNTDK